MATVAPVSKADFVQHLLNINFQLDGGSDYKRVVAEYKDLTGGKVLSNASVWKVLEDYTEANTVEF